MPENEDTKSVQTSVSTSSDSSSPTELCPPGVVKAGYHVNPNESLGKGAFAEVYKARSDKLPDKIIACKYIEIKKADTTWRESCMKMELAICKKIKEISHPNIVKVHDVIKTRRFVFIFMDYAVNGSVAARLIKNGKPFQENQTKTWMKQIFSAINYLHNHKIAHRDIKLENFLLDDKDEAMLTDFSFGCFSRSSTALNKTFCGSLPYVAPEVIQCDFQGNDSIPYDAKKADLFSLGVCMFQMLNLMPPFTISDNPTEDNKKLLVKQMKERNYNFNPFASKLVSAAAKNLIDKLLEPDPKKRFDAKQALEHHWFPKTS